MGRPRKDDAEYFSHDKHMRNDERIKMLRKKFGHEGYSLWCMLLEKLTDSPNFRLRFETEIHKESLSVDFEVESEKLDQVVAYMVRVELIRNENGVIYSQRLIERLQPLLDHRERNR